MFAELLINKIQRWHIYVDGRIDGKKNSKKKEFYKLNCNNVK